MTFSCDPEYKKAFEKIYGTITGDCCLAASAASSSDPSVPAASSAGPDIPADLDPDPDFDPDVLARLYESSLMTCDRKRSGTYYTSPEIVRFMCRDVLAHYLSNHIGLSYSDIYNYIKAEEGMDPDIAVKADRAVKADVAIKADIAVKADIALENIRIFDPATGCGEFVIGMLDEIVRLRSILQIEKHPFLLKYNAVKNSIYGVDIDPAAVEITRLRLWHSLMSGYEQYRRDAEASRCHMEESPGFDSFRCNIVCTDSLFEYDVFGFDAVIGNPPYISAVESSRSGNERRRALKKKYPQLKGAFDIYTAFLIDGIRRTNEKGVYCWIVPNKLLVSQYAAPVLEHLKENGLLYSVSVSDIGVFSGVGVYPVIITGNKSKAAVNSFREYTAKSLRHLADRCFVTKPEMKAYETFADHGIRIASGAAGFQAKILQQYIREGPYAAEDIGQQGSLCCNGHNIIPFAVSGSIDKYCLRRSNVRYMGITYREPFIIKGDKIAESKWELWCREKICIAGLTREIEAYYSREPLALGVGVYALCDFGGFEPLYLLALLNSKFMSWYLREKFHERHLSGDYLAVNKFALEQLPLARADEAVQKMIALMAEKLLALYGAGAIKEEAAALLNEIDEMVYRLYDLDSDEIDMIQSQNI